jgi:hypothetical protein
MIFSFTPIVPQLFEESEDSINTLTFAAVFALLFTTLTLKSVKTASCISG